MTQAVFVDVWNEVIDVRREASHLAAALSRQGQQTTSDEQNSWEQTHIRASAIEKIYTGCERIMAQLANGFDKAAVTHSDGWHVSLLKRMANPFPDVREAVISSTVYAQLDRLRSFRHRARNSYGIDLDQDIVLLRAKQAIETFESFQEEIRQFMLRRAFDTSVMEQAGSKA